MNLKATFLRSKKGRENGIERERNRGEIRYSKVLPLQMKRGKE